MPKTVKSGVVTKRSTVAVTQDRCLDVKVNVTGETTIVIYGFSPASREGLDLGGFGQPMSPRLWHHDWPPVVSQAMKGQM